MNINGGWPCVNGQEFEYPFSVNANELESPKIGKSGNIWESGKIDTSVNLVLVLIWKVKHGLRCMITRRTPHLCRDSSSFALHEVRILRRLEVFH